MCLSSIISHRQIERFLKILTRTTAHLCEIKNARAPLCKLPVEILTKILDFVPDPLGPSSQRLELFWYSAAKDSTMLLPITRTCRYLRSVALSNPWTVTTSSTFPATPSFIRDSVPLIVVVTPSEGFKKILDAFYPSHARSIREIHFTNIGCEHINYCQSLVKYVTPELRSYAFCGTPRDFHHWQTYKLPLSPDSTLSLRHLDICNAPLLPPSPLPRLTHLSLRSLAMPGLHTTIANFLPLCPELEALVLSSLQDQNDHTLIPNPRPLHLAKLRRLTIHGMIQPALQFYLTLFPWGDSQSAIQLLSNVRAASVVSPWLSRDLIVQEATVLAFTNAHHRSPPNWHGMAITMVTPKHVAHVVRSDHGIRAQPHNHSTVDVPNWYADILSRAIAFSSVREVWVTNVCVERDPEFGVLRSIIRSLPTLETLVLKDTSHHGNTIPLSPDLRMCPSALDSSFQSHRLKTLRLVHGLPPQSSSAHTYVLYALSLTDMLGQLRTGAYDYFDRLIVQVARQLVVNEADIARLREHFSMVRVEYVDVLPDIALPAYCEEPKAGHYKSRPEWVGALW